MVSQESHVLLSPGLMNLSLQTPSASRLSEVCVPWYVRKLRPQVPLGQGPVCLCQGNELDRWDCQHNGNVSPSLKKVLPVTFAVAGLLIGTASTLTLLIGSGIVR